MNGPGVDQHGNQFPIYQQQQQPLPAPPRRGIDKTTWFGISAGILVVFSLGTATGSAVSAQATSTPTPTPSVTVTAKPIAVEVTPQSCLDAIQQSAAYVLLLSNAMEYADQGIGGALARDAVAMDAATKGAADTRASMAAIGPVMIASSAECRAKAK